MALNSVRNSRHLFNAALPWLLSCTWRLGHYHVAAITYCSFCKVLGGCGMGEIGLNWMVLDGTGAGRGARGAGEDIPTQGCACGVPTMRRDTEDAMSRNQYGFGYVSRMNLDCPGVLRGLCN